MFKITKANEETQAGHTKTIQNVLTIGTSLDLEDEDLNLSPKLYLLLDSDCRPIS